jgi:hypothetical protein
VAVLLGAVLCGVGYEEYRIGAGSADGAEDVELARLESGYVPQNQHLHIGRHLRDYKTIEYAARGQNARVDRDVEYAFYPLLPADSPGSNVEEFKVLVKTSQFRRVSQLPKENEISPSIDGLLINRVSSLSAREAQLIRESYPQIEPDKLLILQEGREPWRPGSALTLCGAGILLISAAAAAAILSARAPTADSVGAAGGQAPAGRKPWDTDNSQKVAHESPTASLVFDLLIGHKIESMMVLVAVVVLMLAGVSATMTVMALFSKSLCLIIGALIVAIPLNMIFYHSVARPKGTEEHEAERILGRTSWLLVAWTAYVLGAGGLLWAIMGW